MNAFAARCFVDAAGLALPYRLLLPERSEPGVRYPLLLLLHGAGERGTDNVAQLGNGIGSLLLHRRAAFPCVAVVPQCPQGLRWVEADWSAASHELPSIPSAPLHAALSLLESVLRATPRERDGSPAAALPSALPNIDPARVYILGLSMGGYGVWDALCREPHRFAAAVPICGGGVESEAPQISAAAVAIWAFHGARDPVVPVERSRRMVAALRSCGAAIRYTEYAEVGHDAWNFAFSDPELLPWLFGQRRPDHTHLHPSRDLSRRQRQPPVQASVQASVQTPPSPKPKTPRQHDPP